MDDSYKPQCDFYMNLPSGLNKYLDDRKWEMITIGCSKTEVYKIISEDEILYLKINEPQPVFNLKKEKEILEWIGHKLPVPHVEFFCEQNGKDYLLISEITGKNSHITYTDEEKKVNIRVLADGLRQIHSLKISDCPIDNTPDTLIQMAKERLEQKKIDPQIFDRRWYHKTPDELFNDIIDLKPEKYDLVFSHGDYCLPNVIIKENQLSGFIDWNYGGINDRYFDIAAVSWSIGFNYGKEWIESFFKDYGLTNIDWNRIMLYQKLNEFFQQ